MSESDDQIGELPIKPDLERPNAARIYDYWLGGAANFAVDRVMARDIMAVEPRVVDLCRANRAFLARAVRYCVGNGIRQFLDLGSGIPTVGNVHDIAQREDPHCRVAYVDVEPVAVAHSARLLADNPLATITQADLQQPERVLASAGVTELLDLDQPVAVLAVMVLQYFPDTAAVARVLAEYRERLAPGSALAVSHLTGDDPDMNMAGIAAGTRGAATNAHPRTRAQVAELLGDAELVPPGLTWVNEWRPEQPTAIGAAGRCGVYVAVGR